MLPPLAPSVAVVPSESPSRPPGGPAQRGSQGAIWGPHGTHGAGTARPLGNKREISCQASGAAPKAAKKPAKTQNQTLGRDFAFDFRERLWGHQCKERHQKCGRVPLNGSDIAIRRTPGAAKTYAAGLMTCGSAWACPVCASKILKTRADEIAEVARAAIPAGWDLALVTQTVRHSAGDDIETMFAGLRAADKALGQDRQFRSWRDAGAYAGQVCRIECTTGPNGAHVHLHKLMFFRRQLQEPEVSELEDLFYDRWAHCVAKKLGDQHVPTAMHGVDVTWATCACGDRLRECECNAPEVVAGWYIAKMGLELAGIFSKSAGLGNRSVWQVAHDLAKTKPLPLGDTSDDLEIWESWCRATKGKRQITWSGARGGRFDVRSELGLRHLDDAEEETEDPEHVVTIYHDEWIACQSVRRDFHLAALHAAESDGAEGVEALIVRTLKIGSAVEA